MPPTDGRANHKNATCPACGAPLSGDAERCPHCGTELGRPGGRFATRLLAPPSPLPEGYVLQGRYRILQVEQDDVDRVTYRAEDALACGHCGHVHQEPAAYCDQCGAELTQPAQLTLVESQLQPTTTYDAHIRFRGRDYFITYTQPEPVLADVTTVTAETPALRWGQCTDVGRQRPHNEDAVSCYVHLATGRPPLALLQVADGLGGQDAGEVASHLAIHTAWDLVCDQVWLPHLRGEALSLDRIEAALRQAVHAANRAVYETRTRQGSNMSTTLTAALLLGDQVVVANVGDSRAYVMDGDGLRRVTRDHSLVQRLVDDGRIAATAIYTHPQRHLIYRSIGDQPTVEADLYRLELAPGDRLVLCSDGLWEMTRDDGLEEALLAEPDPQRACQRLCRLANLAGGEDNITIVVAELASAAPAKEE